MTYDKIKVMSIVNSMCNANNTDCRGLSLQSEARKILDIVNVPQNADIQEIPLNWNDQVVILFLLPNDDNYYSLFAGIGNDKQFHLELTICGKLVDNDYFDFYDEEQEIDINYFELCN